MTTIHTVMDEIYTVVDQLVVRTQEIDSALQTITYISEQTNLLSLNVELSPLALENMEKDLQL